MMKAGYEAKEYIIDSIYYMDDADQSQYSWFGSDYFGDRFDPLLDTYDSNIPNPSLFYVYISSVDDVDYDRYVSSEFTLADRIIEFLTRR